MSTLGFFLLLASPFIGSFISASASLWPNWRGMLHPRSRCDRCNLNLTLKDLVPVLSFIWLGGKCRSCQIPIPLLHPVAEISAILIAIAAVIIFQNELQLITALMGWLLLFGSLVDIRLRLLPDGTTIGLVAAGLITIGWIQGLEQFWWHLLAAGIGFGAFYVISKVYRLVRGREGLGLGDAKLLAAGGAWLGPFALSWIVLLAGFFALFSLYITGWIRKTPPKADTALSFGPALSLAIFILWLISAAKW